MTRYDSSNLRTKSAYREHTGGAFKLLTRKMSPQTASSVHTHTHTHTQYAHEIVHLPTSPTTSKAPNPSPQAQSRPHLHPPPPPPPPPHTHTCQYPLVPNWLRLAACSMRTELGKPIYKSYRQVILCCQLSWSTSISMLSWATWCQEPEGKLQQTRVDGLQERLQAQEKGV